MSSRIIQLIVFAFTGFLFMTMSFVFGWGRKLWSPLNKKVDKQFDIIIWIGFAGVITIILHLLLITGVFSNFSSYRIIKGFVLGVYLAAMPNIDNFYDNT